MNQRAWIVVVLCAVVAVVALLVLESHQMSDGLKRSVGVVLLVGIAALSFVAVSNVKSGKQNKE